MTDETPLNADISPTLHPLSIAPLKAVLETTPATARAFNAGSTALKNLYDSMVDLERVNELTRAKFGVGVMVAGGRTIATPLPDEVAATVAADFGLRFERTARAFDEQITVVHDVIDKLDNVVGNSMTHKSNTPKDAAVASDIRNFVRGLPDAKRMDWLHERIKDGDVQVVSAVLESPWVAGIDRQQVETIKDLASMKLAPVERSQIDTAKKLHAHLVQASKLWVTRYQKMVPKVRPDGVAAATRKLREG
jgi:hypothetical protein